MSELHRFLFEGMPVRGMLVRLTDSWQDLQRRRAAAGAHAPAVRDLLGEMCAAATLMHANLKFRGALILQLHGDGPVKLAVAEVQPDLRFRATATVLGELPDEANIPSLLNQHGLGRCSITLDPIDREPGQQPYQGVVPLHDGGGHPLLGLSDVVEHYMLQSEQLQTRLVLAADEQLAAGLLIQRLPVAGAGNLAGERSPEPPGASEAYQRIALLAATLRRDELLTLDADTILRRLFWEEPMRRYEPLRPQFACRCSRQRVRAMLDSLGRDEAEDIVAERGEIEIACEFCGLRYRFDAVDVAEMFTPRRDHPPGSPSLQ